MLLLCCSQDSIERCPYIHPSLPRRKIKEGAIENNATFDCDRLKETFEKFQKRNFSKVSISDAPHSQQGRIRQDAETRMMKPVIWDTGART